jgi:hypothetical protein
MASTTIHVATTLNVIGDLCVLTGIASTTRNFIQSFFITSFPVTTSLQNILV